jgi:DNA-binding transcriptional ArsR family regulator
MTAPADIDAGPGDLWRALASPWRRQLLDLLRSGPKTTGELATAVPALSRFAVMQHLEVLTAAGVVLVRRRGRYRVNHLNPVPLRRFYERWVQPFADETAAALLALQRVVETTGGEAEKEGETVADEVRVVRVACELTFRTTAEKLFHTMTQNTLAWFPVTYGEERVKQVVFEPRVGGALYEDWGDGAGHLYAEVTLYDPPRAWSTRGRLGPGVVLDSEYEITDAGDGVVTLAASKVAIGPLTDEDAAGISKYGDVSRFADAIRKLVE